VEYRSSNANDQIIPNPDSSADDPDTAASYSGDGGPATSAGSDSAAGRTVNQTCTARLRG
jgi:hypothetical protein